MNWPQKFFFLSLLLLVQPGLYNFVVQAATKPELLSIRPHKIGEYFSSGVVTGGRAGTVFSLVKARHQTLKGDVERITLEYGDIHGAALSGEPGYFHISVDRKNQRVILDLAQVIKTAVDAQDLNQMFSMSRLISSSEITMDPEDRSTNILLRARLPLEVKVSLENSLEKMNQVLIEIRPILVGSKK